MANLVKNGNFDNVLTNWTQNAANALAINPYRGIVPSTINYFGYLNAAPNNYIYQDTPFSAGNYSISFWTTSNNNPNNSSLQVSIGSINQPIYYTTGNSSITGWKYYTIPFFVNTNSTQRLKFVNNNTTNDPLVGVLWITGVSIVSTDYTLDLYLEWIPDEEVEKNY